MKRSVPLLIAASLLTGCAVGPNYKRPTVSVPPAFRSAGTPTTDATSIADTKWFDLFKDEVLTQLVSTALQDNFDLRIAAERVLEARAQLGITRSELAPTLNATGEVNSVRTSQIGQFRLPAGSGFFSDVTYNQAGFTLAWELDVWGRLRRLTEAARAQYLASEEARRGVVTTLVSDVTTAYFQLRELDLELDIARKSRTSAENSLRLTIVRRNRGVATGLDVHQAEQFLYSTSGQIASIERSIAQTENAINLLLGQSPGEVARGKALNEFAVPAQLPPGLPSSLLERRPDIRAAEQSLIAANAQIGAAKAQYFPQFHPRGDTPDIQRGPPPLKRSLNRSLRAGVPLKLSACHSEFVQGSI
jgi:multidrug efflux system outer membrane protein